MIVIWSEGRDIQGMTRLAHKRFKKNLWFSTCALEGCEEVVYQNVLHRVTREDDGILSVYSETELQAITSLSDMGYFVVLLIPFTRWNDFIITLELNSVSEIVQYYDNEEKGEIENNDTA